MGAPLQSIQKERGGFRLTGGKKILFCEKLVNASGAWAAHLSEKAGAQRIPLIPYQRHLFWSRSLGRISAQWPFVWHVSHDFYFRPDKNSLMLSPCDKTSYGNEKIDPKMENMLKRKLAKFSNYFKAMKFYEAKAGLRTMAPDGRFVIGEDPKLPHFYWVAGLGGHGVTTSFSVGELASDIILGYSKDARLNRAFSPERFC